MVLRRVNVIFLILLIGFLGVLIVWINNVVYKKAKYLDELKDERDMWYVKYMNSIKNYYQRRWGYEVQGIFNSNSSDSLVSDSTSKIIPNSDIR